MVAKGLKTWLKEALEDVGLSYGQYVANTQRAMNKLVVRGSLAVPYLGSPTPGGRSVELVDMIRQLHPDQRLFLPEDTETIPFNDMRKLSKKGNLSKVKRFYSLDEEEKEKSLRRTLYACLENEKPDQILVGMDFQGVSTNRDYKVVTLTDIIDTYNWAHALDLSQLPVTIRGGAKWHRNRQGTEVEVTVPSRKGEEEYRILFHHMPLYRGGEVPHKKTVLTHSYNMSASHDCGRSAFHAVKYGRGNIGKTSMAFSDVRGADESLWDHHVLLGLRMVRHHAERNGWWLAPHIDFTPGPELRDFFSKLDQVYLQHRAFEGGRMKFRHEALTPVHKEMLLHKYVGARNQRE